MTFEDLTQNIKRKKSLLCVGLDADRSKIPAFLREKQNPIFEFNKKIIEATQSYAIAFKPNIAFYESLGSQGWLSLEKTVKYIKTKYPDIFLIADAKRADIGNSSRMYARTFFQNMNFDAVTVSPYMGKDSIEPFLAYENKWTICLALTSNPGSQDFQHIVDQESGKKVFQKVLEKASEWGGKEKMMFVAGATQAERFKELREIVPEHFFLVPGVGAQGGNLEQVMENGLNEHAGLIINSSRAIIYADNTESFAEASAQEALKIQQIMESYLNRNGFLD